MSKSPSITPEQVTLLRRAKAARQLIIDADADPAVMLALVVWPSEDFVDVETLLVDKKPAARQAAA